jgi:hypothetical protein
VPEPVAVRSDLGLGEDDADSHRASITRGLGVGIGESPYSGRPG